MRGVVALALAVAFAPLAFGYSAPAPHSFAKPTAGGKFVLVMLQPQGGAGDKQLKEKYGRSGLYPSGESTKSTWVCDWRADWERSVFASDDGAFALRVPDGDPGLRRWVLSYEKSIPAKQAGWEDAPVLFVYKNGQQFRTLALKDVFDPSRFTNRDCFMGPIITIDSFDDATGHVVISTEAGGRKRTATVAFRTGEVVERDSSGGVSLALFDGGDITGPAGRRWGRFALLGGVVVGTLTAAFVVAAVLLIRNQRVGRS
jgi:hypothetical protein